MLHYFARDFFAAVLPVGFEDGDALLVYAVSDLSHDLELWAVVRHPPPCAFFIASLISSLVLLKKRHQISFKILKERRRCSKVPLTICGCKTRILLEQLIINSFIF